jgi:hypothetical protein
MPSPILVLAGVGLLAGAVLGILALLIAAASAVAAATAARIVSLSGRPRRMRAGSSATACQAAVPGRSGGGSEGGTYAAARSARASVRPHGVRS